MADDALDRRRPVSPESRRLLDAYSAGFVTTAAPQLRGRSATFSCEVFQNEQLPEGGTDVHAVVALTCSQAEAPAASGKPAEILVVATSDSMRGERIEALREAVVAAVDQIPDGVWFAVIAGTEVALRAFPPPELGSPMVRMTPRIRAAARETARSLSAGGGRALGSWLRLATRLFETAPLTGPRHAVLLTDGHNADESPEELAAAVREATGGFQCDCLGLGVDWNVGELRSISSALLGSVGLVPEPGQLVEALSGLVWRAMTRGIADARLQVWAPPDARVLLVRQIAPQIEDLTDRRTDVTPLLGVYPTGAWSNETREYHIAVRLTPRSAGSELVAAEVQFVVDDEVKARGLIKAVRGVGRQA